MPTTNDDAPAPRARRRLGRGPGAGTSEPEPPVAPEVTEEPAAPEALVERDPVEAPESPEATGTPVGTETPDAPEAQQIPEAPEPPHVPQTPQAPSAAAAVPEVDAGQPGGAAGLGETSGEAGGGRFTLRLENFEGPFDLLLQLISKHKLDVTEVALSKVTDDFMAHIRAMGPDWDLDQTTEFLVVAATLLDLKAARLLPVAEVEDEADLALLEARDLLFARLLQYRAYKRIADIFSDRLADEARRHPRTVGLEPQYAELLPEVVISIGAEGFARLAVKAMQPKARPQVYVDHIHAPLVSVREQAGVVMARLREVGETTFQELVADAADTLTVVARFLALLELYRERVVDLDQAEALGALTVRWTGAEGAAPRVTDEFDRDPQERATAEQSSGAARSAEAAQDGRAEEERT
ncbi:segregation and condensation protein A [Streptomyces lydicus]|uniref:segregation and condensation protein A n=1 Tax=Streptomyces lydicus TaxID=47763 RepID=UPI00286FD1C1|nr:segregation/condensation protein A [Streptomyces lydicus]